MIFIDVEGRSAQFRNHFYNSSFVSYPYPPRTVVFGMLASILGYEHDSYHEEFKNSKLAVCIKSKHLYKQIITVNHREPKNPQQGNIITPVHLEYIKSQEGKVQYRIYYGGENERKILKAIENFEGFHLYLGVTECLATVTDYGECIYKKIDSIKDTTFQSVVPVELINNLYISNGNKYYKYEKYKNIYGWNGERGKSLGVYNVLCETRYGEIYCKLKRDLTLTIAKLKDGKERKIEAQPVITGLNDNIILF